ncbi:MAG: hypothetical protein KDD11_16765 [Acidobacteria bacterium]|nr:hypothetical protein [Acidobacteriota bacterium]
MIRKLVLILVPLAALAAWLAVRASAHRPWTTDSPAALAAFEQGLEAEMKLYAADAAKSYFEALDLDPSFVAPRIFLLQVLRPHDERYPQIVAALRAADPDPLTERERFLRAFELARVDQDEAEFMRLLDGFVAQHPDDPFGLRMLCQRESVVGDVLGAEHCYQRLVEVEPNWVQAQNLLGYLAMRQGQFDEAEKRFQIYQFIAPDQANPHDSMAELMTVRGRYEEAHRELDKALELRPDFYSSYDHLLFLALAENDPQLLAATRDRVVEAFSGNERPTTFASCRYALFAATLEVGSDFAKIQECPKDGVLSIALFHTLALRAEGPEAALTLEEHLRERLKATPVRAGVPVDKLTSSDGGLLLHLEGMRHAVSGDLETARDALQAADETFELRELDEGLLLLRNRLVLAEVLESLGDAAAGRRERQRITDINPRFLETEPYLGLPALR